MTNYNNLPRPNNHETPRTVAYVLAGVLALGAFAGLVKETNDVFNVQPSVERIYNDLVNPTNHG